MMKTYKTNLLGNTVALVLLIITVLLFTGCKKEKITPIDDNQSTGGGGGGSTGQGMFWVASDLGCGNITVNCEGTSKTITSYYNSGTPACGATGGANFNLAGGTYSYTASCSGKTWSGNITITNGSCSRIQLTSSGGSGGGGGGSACSSYSLSGTWLRYSGGATGCPGQRVSSTSTTGTTIYSPSGCRFSVNDIAWKNYNSTNCTMEILYKNQDGSGATYLTNSISFNSSTEFVLGGDVVWRKQ